ncbi:protein adenylyltransferase SelO family protein [Alteraurantiacibacter aquimixticola]|uniref:Protein nucleotidyltransferase YdiU n=1 Tax=Alteraurantiacibacter aquimixticola TaxID=2489173 RepID=A0A4T3F1V1_9SPHN|nr:YdiU family protein [Alteraurantiacibacter aquimixticola]TIX50547.1 YdiU family protein [Alteraurantiacibacter aquimixticola]
MRAEPQAAAYRPDPQITAIAEWIGDAVEPAGFPRQQLRFRNDRWAKAVGLNDLSDADWTRHFGAFEPLPDNLPQPLALKYHGHQFRVYNPEIGDGRGFLFAQLRDGEDRLLDLGTKGSGTTPYSRTADGRLTLKGAVREILATEMLEAQGVYTSKTFSVVETGEELWRNDEPSPTRSAVLTRLSHGHIRIGSFQRLAALGEHEQLAALVDYTLTQFPGPPPPEDAPGRDEPAIRLMHLVVERLADLAASYMVAGFVHGVLNTDNMNVSGESFDYGPWRWLPHWDPSFTAAYFDESGLYAFGRQPEALRWNLGQLAIALRPLVEAEPLIAALDRYGPCYEANMVRRFCWRLGVESRGVENDGALIAAAEVTMREGGIGPDAFFHAYRFGRNATGALAEALEGYQPAGDPHDYWDREEPESMLIEEVEAIWDAIDKKDDWSVLQTKVSALRNMSEALGPAPAPAGLGSGG